MKAHSRRWTLAAATIVAAGLAGMPPTAAAHNGETFSLHRFVFTRYADSDLTFFARWRVTVCTSGPARLRIRAVVETETRPTERHRFIRRQPAGCTRHRLQRPGADSEGTASSRLRVAWRDQRRRTGWVDAADPAPD